MRFGVFTFLNDTGIGPADLATALESRGFGSLFVTEHSHIPVNTKTPYPMGGPIPPQYYRTLDPFVSLTAAAVATESLLLGTGISLVTSGTRFRRPKRSPRWIWCRGVDSCSVSAWVGCGRRLPTTVSIRKCAAA